MNGDRYADAALARIEAAVAPDVTAAEPPEILPVNERTNPVSTVRDIDYVPRDDEDTEEMSPSATGTLVEMRALAGNGDGAATRRLIQLYSQQEDEAEVRHLADSGDGYAIAGWIRSLAEHRSEDELRELITDGDRYAPAALFLKFVNSGDNSAALEVLRPSSRKANQGRRNGQPTCYSRWTTSSGPSACCVPRRGRATSSAHAGSPTARQDQGLRRATRPCRQR